MQWHTIGEASRGEKTLYHAQISPEARYPMTEEQFLRAAEILAEDLGMADHPRAVVIHMGHDRPHAHVVFQRANSETLKLWDDGFNYVKHERASLRMEREFKHEIVPGKHAKRDRKKQPEFPRQDMSRDEAQIAKRTGKDLKKLKGELAAMRANAESPQAFKAAIENAGFILANGDRGYTVVDEKGATYNLARQMKLKVAEVNEYMAPVALASLPTAEQAQAMQAVARQTVSKSNAPANANKPENQGVEASKFAQAPAAEKSPEPAPVAPEAAEKKPRQPEPVDPARKAQITALRAWSDGAKAFKQALEGAGYTLARGKTGYLLFSEEGTFSLTRHAGLPKSRLEGFMSPIPLDSLPSVQDLITAQREAQKRPHAVTVQELPVAPVLPRPPATKDIDLGARMELSALDMAAEAIAEAQRPAPKNLDPELEAIENAVAKRYEEEAGKLREMHEFELRGKEVEMDREIARQLAGYKDVQDQQAEAFLHSRKEYRTGIWGIIDAINSRWNPTQAAEKTKARETERQNFYRRLAKERADYEALIQQTKALEIENLIERQRLQLRDLDTRTAEDKDRYFREHHDAKRIAAEMEQERLQQEELEHNDCLREGPPPPKLGK